MLMLNFAMNLVQSPGFLPIGNKKLLTHQISSLREQFSEDIKIVVSLPSTYALSIEESLLLDELNIEPIFVQDGISLGMALLYVLNTIGDNNEPLRFTSWRHAVRLISSK